MERKRTQEAISKLEEMASFFPSPLAPLSWLDAVDLTRFSIWVKRDDLIHPVVSGNKYRKLYYNVLAHLDDGDQKGLMTMGGAFSNHLAATAAMGEAMGIPVTCLVKYHQIDEGNPTMKFCREKGASLIPVGRRPTQQDVHRWAAQNNARFIPEGGGNAAGRKGVVEMVREIYREITPDFIITSMGQGGTLAGIADALDGHCRVVGVSCFAEEAMRGILLDKMKVSLNSIHLYDASRYGKFGEMSRELFTFCQDFHKRNGFELDPIYTSRMFLFAARHILGRDIPIGSTVVFIHTGGLQGWEGMQYRGLI